MTKQAITLTARESIVFTALVNEAQNSNMVHEATDHLIYEERSETPQSLGGILSNLVKKGLIRLTQDDSCDEEVSYFSITEAGEALAADIA